MIDINNLGLQGNVSRESDGNKDLIVISDAGGVSGCKTDQAIEVDPSSTYVFSFSIKKSMGANLTVGVQVSDKNNLKLSLINAADGTSTNNFLVNAALVRDDYYIPVVCILYHCKQPLLEGQMMELNQGNNLILDENTQFIEPVISIIEGHAIICDLKIELQKRTQNLMGSFIK